MLNFLVASQRMALVFYFLPTLFSAYHFGRRHATLTALASVVLVVLLVYLNPAMFTRRVELPFAPMVRPRSMGWSADGCRVYATGTLYERNQKTLREMEEGYDGMLVILQNFLANQKYSDTHAYRISMCATKIAEGGWPGRWQHRRHSYGGPAVQHERSGNHQRSALQSGAGIAGRVAARDAESWESAVKAGAMSGSLRRAIPIFLAERQLRQNGGKPEDASLEVQILVLAEEYEALTTGQRGAKMSPSQAGQEVIKRAGEPLRFAGAQRLHARLSADRRPAPAPEPHHATSEVFPTSQPSRAFRSAVSCS